MERKCNELTWLIKAQANASINRADEIMKELEQEIAELRRRDTQMSQLLQKENPSHFFQVIQ